MLVADNVDCSNMVCQFMSYVDIICFKSINHAHYKYIILPNFKKLFMNKILECEVVPSLKEAELFCETLYTTGAYVAGSFILDLLLGTNYHDDIDIYDQTGIDTYMSIKNGTIEIPTPVNEELNLIPINDENKVSVRYCHPSYFDNFTSDNLKFTQYLYNTGFENIDFTSYKNTVLRSYINKSSSKYNLRNKIIFDHNKPCIKDTIQIIPVDLKIKHGQRSVVPRFIKASFDLEICQNIFDGRHVYIKNLHKLIHKYNYIKVNTMFTISVYASYKESYKNYKHEVTMKRMKKYRQRGFDVQLHPKHEEMNNMIYKLFDNDHDEHTYIKYIDDGTIDLSKYDMI